MGGRVEFNWSKLDYKTIYELFHDEGVILREAPPWTGKPEKMAPGTRKGLGLSILISKATTNVIGTAIDPATGRITTRKALQQQKVAKLPVAKIAKIALKKAQESQHEHFGKPRNS